MVRTRGGVVAPPRGRRLWDVAHDTAGPEGNGRMAASVDDPLRGDVAGPAEGIPARAIATLSGDQQAATRMRGVDGMATQDIAERIGKSDVAVRVMLSRTVQKLQQLLGK